MTKFLAISGSLRKQSYNSYLLQALKEIAPAHIELSIFKQMADIPLFNPDLEHQSITVIEDLKTAIAQSDGLIIASPEYAHGVSGVIKNTLDWLVSGEEFVYKPIAVYNTSPRASIAQLSLREILKTMSALVIESASISVPLLGSGLDSKGIVNDDELVEILSQSLNSFVESINMRD